MFIHSFSIGVKCHKFGRKILKIKNNSKRRKKKRDNGSKHIAKIRKIKVNTKVRKKLLYT